MLVNILDNSAKYSQAGGPIELAATLDGERVSVTVSDEGPGIPPEARDTVFDVFYRVRAGDKQPAGTRLGLSICRGLIEAHGGQIEALPGQSRRGNTIAFGLPVHRVPAIADRIYAADIRADVVGKPARAFFDLALDDVGLD